MKRRERSLRISKHGVVVVPLQSFKNFELKIYCIEGHEQTVADDLATTCVLMYNEATFLSDVKSGSLKNVVKFVSSAFSKAFE